MVIPGKTDAHVRRREGDARAMAWLSVEEILYGRITDGCGRMIAKKKKK